MSKHSKPSLPPAILLMGPTASGKTALACALCDDFPLEIISVDSAQVFCDMTIGTAKPNAITQARYPHALIDLISPEESYSAARFREDALLAMQKIHAKGRVPLLVGGTMLYFRALLEGLANLPSADLLLREKIATEAKAYGWHVLHEKLRRIDPDTADRLSKNDSQRIQRALEICALSGQPMSALLAAQKPEKPAWDFLSLALFPTRDVLHQRIADRFAAMLLAGLEEEVEMLRKKYHLHLELPSMRSVGYRQVFECQDALFPQKELLNRGIFATRQLAKRQMTWINRFDAVKLDAMADDLVDTAKKQVALFLRQRGFVLPSF